MKKLLNPGNLVFILALLYAAYSLVPSVKNNFSQEGRRIETKSYRTITTKGPEQSVLFPAGNRSIAIFWATWCAPCKLEMARLSRSVEEGKIPAGAIIAVNPFETPDEVRAFLKKNSYPFTFIEDSGLSGHLNVNRTPTTLFIESQKVVNLSSGLSFTGIWSAENFLSQGTSFSQPLR